MRKAIHDKLITDFSNLTHESSSNKLFADTKKYYFEIPTNTPSCRIIPISQGIEVVGNTTDNRAYRFQADIYELIESSATQAEAELKIDRLGNIEDSIVAYLEKIPDNLEHAITGIHVTSIDITNVFYNYEVNESGTVVYLSIAFDINVIITPQLL